ncbi:MAG: hypothetical protein ABFD92_08705 [Planctomycetaceae bacterium]|nr:hypothetical protein [Planctomycetaceae bacterium]
MFRSIVCVLVALAWIANPLAAEEKKAPVKKAPAKAKLKAGLKGEYAIMASTLELTEEQQTKLAETVKAQQLADVEAAKADKAKVADAQKAMTEAKQKKDAAATEAAKKALAEAKAAIKTNKTALDEKQKAEIQALLTDEQKSRWMGFTISRTVLREMAWAKVTPAQKTKIETIAMETAPKMRGEGKSDQEIVTAVKASAVELLTDAQKGLDKSKDAPKVKGKKKDAAEEKKPAAKAEKEE